MLSVSVVSHGQAALVQGLLADLAAYCRTASMQVILTVNVPEHLPFSPRDFPFALDVVTNLAPRGFGANHNAAFRHATGEFFCVVNPDIRLVGDPFPPLCAALREQTVGVVAPKVLRPDGSPEIHVRSFPRATTILKKALFGIRSDFIDVGDTARAVDWVAGMFMIFRTEVFRSAGGFDERYFLYYEDVDLCARLHRAEYEVRVEPVASVVHHARHSSHRHPRFFLWHLRSMMRYLLTRPRALPSL